MEDRCRLVASWHVCGDGHHLRRDIQVQDCCEIGALDLLISTPLTVNEIVRGQRLALQRQFQLPIAVFVALSFVLLIAGVCHYETTVNDRTYCVSTGLIAGVVFFADLAALFWTGIWQGVSVKSHQKVFGGTFVPILVVAWIVLILLVTAFPFLPPGLLQQFNDATSAITSWFVLCWLTDVGFRFWARHQFLTNFPMAAAQRF